MIASTSLYSAPVKAASEADCGIWLCLPTGFPSGCGESKDAFKKRIKKFRPPLPSFIGCMIKQDQIPPQLADSYKPSDMSYIEGVAARMPNNIYIEGDRCVKQYRGSELYIWSPKGCTGTYRFIKTYLNGVKTGNTYFY